MKRQPLFSGDVYKSASRRYNNGVSKLLTTAEVAAYLGLSLRQVQTLAKSGDLPAEKHGRDYVVRSEDLEQFTRRPVGRPRKGEGE